jgi:hypothetical protein
MPARFESNRTGENQIWKTPVAGGPDVQVTWQQGVDAAESHDGGFLYYTKLHERGIWKRAVQGGEEVFVTGRGRPNLWAMHAAGLGTIETDAAVESVRSDFGGRGGTIECLDFADGQCRTVATLPPSTRIHRGGRSISVSSDGQWILYVVQTREESDVMLVENFR